MKGQARFVRLLEELQSTLAVIPPPIFVSPQSPVQSSIGAHFRHIIEFCEQLTIGYQDGIVSYDARNRSLELESSPEMAKQALSKVRNKYAGINEDRNLILSNDVGNCSTTFSRELQFLIDHVVHHFAIIAIACRLAKLEVPIHAGWASATLKDGRYK